MSEQTNPTPEMETETAESGAVGEVEVTQSRPAQPPVYVEDVADVNEEDEAYEEELDDEDEEESFRAPDQYVEREGFCCRAASVQMYATARSSTRTSVCSRASWIVADASYRAARRV